MNSCEFHFCLKLSVIGKQFLVLLSDVNEPPIFELEPYQYSKS